MPPEPAPSPPRPAGTRRPVDPTPVDRAAAALLAGAAAPGGMVSVWAGDLAGETLLVRDADAVHYAASTIKVALVATAYRLHEAGALDLDAEVAVHDRFASAADGSAYLLDRDDDQDADTWALRGGRCSLRRLAEQAITRSGNLATNLLLEQVGPAAVAATLAAAGCSEDTVLALGVGDAAARCAGRDNTVTAADLGLLLRGLGARTLAAPATCAAVEALLARQRWRDGIPAGLPEGTYVANKTGWVQGVTHDLALVRPGAAPAYVLVVLTTAAVPEPAGNAFIAEVSRLVFEAVAG